MQSFSELPLSAPIQKAITELGYEKPSPIQAETLPILLGEATDFLGLAATGTGKTAAFGIPMLERLDSSIKAVQTLILCPTRELAIQVAGQIDLLGKFKGVRSVPVYGGASYVDQIAGLKRGTQVVVGTPGRVIDHLERGTLKLENLTTVILDEADEMISMGFKDELEKILASVPRETSNIWLFSATMSRDVRKVADDYLRSPKQVQVNRTEMLPTSVEQLYYPVHESDKPEIICKLIEAAEDFYGLIFCQTKALVVDLTRLLNERGYKTDCLHGDMEQPARERTMQAFRDRRVKILVCTDVASRGLDVKDITHVINYSLPRELDNYVHRIGRTARSGKTGVAMNLVTPSHRSLLLQLERFTKTRMIEGTIPTRREIGAKKVGKLLPTFEDQPFHTRALEVMSDEWKQKLAGMTPEEVAARFLGMMMPEIFADREKKNKTTIAPRAAAPRAERSFDGPREARGPRAPREFSGPRSGARPERSFDGPREARSAPREFNRSDRGSFGPGPARDFGGPRETRSFDRDARSADDVRAPREFRRPRTQDESAGGQRPPRREGDAVAPRAERSFDGPREARGPRAERPAFAPRTERPLRDSAGLRHERPHFSPRAVEKTTDARPESPFAARSPKRHAPTPAAQASEAGGEPIMNRRARRAAKFGNTPWNPQQDDGEQERKVGGKKSQHSNPFVV